MIEKLYTVEEVAELASVTGRTIRNYLKSGRLVGRKIGGQWRFPENEVQRLLTGAEPEPTQGPAAESAAPVAPAAPAADPAPPDDEPFFSGADAPEEADPVPAEASAAPYTYARPAPLPSPEAPPPQAAFSAPSPVSAPLAQSAPPASAPAAAAVHPVASPPAAAPVAPPATPYAPQQQAYNYPPQPTAAAAGPQNGGYQAGPAPYTAPVSPQELPPQGYPAYPYQTPAPLPSTYPPAPSAGAPYAPPQAPAPYETSPQPSAVSASNVATSALPSSDYDSFSATKQDTQALLQLSDVGKRVTKFIAEVHDCSHGPQMCTIIDVHQSLSAARSASEQLAAIANEESEGGQLCQSFVEFDERYFVARYTLFGTSSFLLRCLKLIG